MNSPLVTINILTYNRKNQLRKTLSKLQEQDYANIKIIVVDNASDDDTAEMLRREFTTIRLISLEKNIGIAGWNRGFELARSEYILVLDDDSYPDINTIRKGVSAMLGDETIGIVAYNIFNTRYGKSETQDSKSMNPTQFTGCGALIRKKLITQIGGYDDIFFIYYNEIDFTIRAYDCRYKIIYMSETVVFHDQSDVSRNNSEQDPLTSKFRFYHYSLGHIYFLWKHFYLRYAVPYTLKWIINRFIICLVYGYFVPFTESLLTAVKLIPILIKKRKVVHIDAQRLCNYGNVPIIDKEYLPRLRSFLCKSKNQQ